MSNTELKHVDPYSINVDEMNERTENLNLGDLEKSVEEQGIIQPPLVRERNGDVEVPYTVVVGQRRVMAAQGVGLDSMPVVVVNWGDAEALESSITENIDAFQEEVSKLDRARAIERLKELRGWSNAQVGDHLSVSPVAIRAWLEPLRDEWDNTPIKEQSETVAGDDNISADEFPDETLRMARAITGGGDDGTLLLKKIDRLGLSKHDVREVKKLADRGVDIPEALEKVAEEKAEEGSIKVEVTYTVTGQKADALRNLAEDRGTSEKRIAAEALESYLEQEGYL